MKNKPTREELQRMLEELLNDVETEGCEDMGTVRLETINKARRLLGWDELG